MKEFISTRAGRFWLVGVGLLLVISIMVASNQGSSADSGDGGASAVYVDPATASSPGSSESGSNYDGSYSREPRCNVYYQGQCYEQMPTFANGCTAAAPYRTYTGALRGCWSRPVTP